MWDTVETTASMKWWRHPGLWMAAGVLAYPLGTGVAWVVAGRAMWRAESARSAST